jgi:hypothetical protein
MSGTYLVCDQCGNFGPPASFIVKEGMRLCYQCAFQDEQNQAQTTEGSERTPMQEQNSSQDK